MDAATVNAVGDVIANTWVAVGPVVGGLLGAWFTARHQRSMEDRKREADAEASAQEWRRRTRSEAYFAVIDAAQRARTYCQQAIWFLRPDPDAETFQYWNADAAGDMVSGWNQAISDLQRAVATARIVADPRVAELGSTFVTATNRVMTDSQRETDEIRADPAKWREYDHKEAAKEARAEMRKTFDEMVTLIRNDLGIESEGADESHRGPLASGHAA